MNTQQKPIVGARQRRKYVLSKPSKTNQELARELGVTPKTVSEYRKGTPYQLAHVEKAVNRKWQQRVSELLTTQGIVNTLVPSPNLHNIEFEDGRRAAVFYCGRAYRQGQYSAFSFWIKKNLRGDYSDFFLLVAGDGSSIYVVPNEAIGRMACINIPAMPLEDKKKKIPSKYSKFLNDFNLLMKLRQETNEANPV